MENTYHSNYYSVQLAKGSHQINEFEIRPEKPFTFAHGWKSPIHINTKISLGYPKRRKLIKDGFLDLIKTHDIQCDVIAGVATGGISHTARIADALDLPETYIYPKTKDHGREDRIAGVSVANKKVLIIDDALSTGRSAAKSVTTIREAGGIVTHCLSIFQYGFPVMEEVFSGRSAYDTESGKKLSKPCVSLSLFDFKLWIAIGKEHEFLEKDTLDLLETWFLVPEQWSLCFDQKRRL